MQDCCWAETGQAPWPSVPSLRPPGVPDRVLGPSPVGWGEQGQKPMQGPCWVTGPACGVSVRGECGRRGWGGRGGGSLKAGREQGGGEKLSGLSQAGAGLSVGGMGSGAENDGSFAEGHGWKSSEAPKE